MNRSSSHVLGRRQRYGAMFAAALATMVAVPAATWAATHALALATHSPAPAVPWTLILGIAAVAGAYSALAAARALPAPPAAGERLR